ncbi:MAG: type II toxin-antitoxin system RelE/ParE family toxin [Tepidisphaerales bacterium]
MPYEVDFDPQAVADMKRLRTFAKTAVLDTVERVLTVSPAQTGRSRIKRLRGLDRPQYRLRVGEFRVFYDVEGDGVYVLRVLAKSDVDDYLKEMGYEA